MKARSFYRLIVTRGGRAPALLADPARTDHIEIVDIEAGEVVLFWDCTPRDASRRAHALREDLGRMDPEEFLATWSEPGAGEVDA
ncbi:MAG TPA: hypothetical protein VGN69_07360 [Solirubrobacteraceae bacterium]|jgi:hypothetical protein|nr:hypothetical protein [Solirubrobacteraceae bacterium]